MNFLGIPERINRLLYQKDIHRLSRRDTDLARRWTLALIRDGHPHWTEDQVNTYYDRLSQIRVEVIDEWSAKHGWEEGNIS